MVYAIVGIYIWIYPYLGCVGPQAPKGCFMAVNGKKIGEPKSCRAADVALGSRKIPPAKRCKKHIQPDNGNPP